MNIGKRLLPLYLVVVIFISAIPTARADMLQDMVHFDQAYIPVLALTSDEKLPPARAAMKTLKPVWKSFKQQYATNKNDPKWQTDIGRIDAYISAGEKIIARGTGLKDAHEELEHVRIVFMEMRERNGIEYFVDHLTRFHKPMEEIVLAAKGKTAKTLTDADIRKVRQTLPGTKQLWQATSKATFDPKLYEFDKSQAETLRKLLNKEQQALSRLEKALQGGDRKEIIAAAVGIKPNFAKIFKTFGRFPAAG